MSAINISFNIDITVSATKSEYCIHNVPEIPDGNHPVEYPEQVFKFYLGDIADKVQEHFVSLTLSAAKKVIRKRIITIGLLDKSQIHPREVFADAITDRAASVIIAHNHPSGNPEPSNPDIRITRQLMCAGNIIGIPIIDHIIVSKHKYFSFQESGLLK